MADDYAGNSSTSGSLVVGGTAGSGLIEQAGDRDWFRVTLVAGTLYLFELRGFDSNAGTLGAGSREAYLSLYDPAGRLLRSAINGGIGDDPAMSFVPSVSGTYFLAASELYDSGMGSYLLRASAMPAGTDDFAEGTSTAGRVVVGGSTTGRIELAHDRDWFAVTLQAGVPYIFDLSGHDSGGGTLGSGFTEARLVLSNSSGLFINSSVSGGTGGDPRLTYTPTVSGTYYLEASDLHDSGTGTYRVSVQANPPVVSIDTAGGGEDDGTLVFELTLSRAATSAVSVVASAAGGTTASAGLDFTALSRTVIFAPGQTRATFSVPVIDDNRFEPAEVFYVNLSSPNGLTVSAAQTFGVVFDNDAPFALPADPTLVLQWYLYPGIGANVLPLWPEYTGQGVRVGVFDQGIDPAHPELDANLRRDLGLSTVTGGAGGSPVLPSDKHGTAVAGVIAAERNGQDIVGVAYRAQLVSLYTPLNGSDQQMAAQIVRAYTAALALDVVNDSWGFAPKYNSSQPWAFLDNFRSTTFAAAGQALKALADSGRHGLGTVVVQSAGNSYAFGDDTNLHNFQNSRYIVTVAATGYDGNVTSYSSPGASVLIAAPGGGGRDPLSDIYTTDRVGASGYADGDFTIIQGTSFSAPVVVGVVALMLEANPALGWRDVQELLAYSAHQTASANHSWASNGANNWNGGGLHFDSLSHNLGFGLVDARAAVRLAETWRGPAATSANDVEVSVSRNTSQTIADNGPPLLQSVTVVAPMIVERVEVTVDVAHSYVGDLSILLVSPAGTHSWLLSRPGQNPLSAYGSAQDNINFTFTTVLSLGESGLGRWELAVFDSAAGFVGTLRSWTLTIAGKADVADDVYVYTDEFAESAAPGSPRTLLVDGGGLDVLNAAAVSTASSINLTPGAASQIDGRSLTLGTTTLIEVAYGGDGNDTLTGNASNNQLHGMRGDDRLDGGAGLDTAWYSNTRAAAVVQKTAAGWSVTGAGDGTDTLMGIERIHFAGSNLALDFVNAAGKFQGTAALAVKAVNALLGASHVADRALMGTVLQLLDNGLSHAGLLSLGVSHPLFAAAAGAGAGPVGAEQFVQHVYKNVVGVAPSPAELALYAGILRRGEMSQADLALLAADTINNETTIQLAGLASLGLDYFPATS